MPRSERRPPIVRLLVAGAILLASFVVAAPAHASLDGFTVNTTADAVDAHVGDGQCATSSGKCSLRAAIQEMDALGQGVNNLTLPSGTYTLTVTGADEDNAAKGDLDIRVPMKILGTVGSTTVKGGTSFGDRVFDLPVGTSGLVQLNGVNVSNGSAPGTENGGGIRIMGSGSVKAINSNFTNNSAGGSGGGLYAGAESLNLSIMTFSGNTAGANGGAIDLEGSASTSNFNHMTVTGNTAFQGGGLAAYVSPGATGSVPQLYQSTFTNNQTTSGGSGGGMAVSRFSAATTTITGNTATFGGGVELVGTSMPTNLAGRITISDNTATQDGGGIYATNCGASCGTLLHVVLESNTANRNGGAMYVNGGLAGSDTTMNGNQALGQGGGSGGTLYHVGSSTGPLNFTNMTIGENTAGPLSGGVVIASTATDVLTSLTIGNNSGGSSNGIAVTGSGVPPQVRNTVVAGTGTMCNRSPSSMGHNLESDSSCAFSKTGDIKNSDPKLGPVQDNGGGTHTMKPGSSSPLIDAGDTANCPVTDQRSVRRPLNGLCDIGAYETGGSALNNDVGFTTFTATVAGSQVTYTMDLKNAGEGASVDSLITDVLPSSLRYVAGSCSATLSGVCANSGQKVTIDYASIALGATPHVTFKATIVGSGKIVDTVTVWSQTPDWFPVDNTATATIQVRSHSLV